jgi:hypothetical protein
MMPLAESRQALRACLAAIEGTFEAHQPEAAPIT